MSLDDYFVDLDEDLRRRFALKEYTDPRKIYKLPEVQEALESSKCKLLKILLDGKPHTVDELIMLTGARRIPARVHELRKMGFVIYSTTSGSPRRWKYTLDLKRLPFPDPLAVVCPKKRGRART